MSQILFLLLFTISFTQAQTLTSSKIKDIKKQVLEWEKSLVIPFEISMDEFEQQLQKKLPQKAITFKEHKKSSTFPLYFLANIYFHKYLGPNPTQLESTLAYQLFFQVTGLKNHIEKSSQYEKLWTKIVGEANHTLKNYFKFLDLIPDKAKQIASVSSESAFWEVLKKMENFHQTSLPRELFGQHWLGKVPLHSIRTNQEAIGFQALKNDMVSGAKELTLIVSLPKDQFKRNSFYKFLNTIPPQTLVNLAIYDSSGNSLGQDYEFPKDWNIQRTNLKTHHPPFSFVIKKRSGPHSTGWLFHDLLHSNLKLPAHTLTSWTSPLNDILSSWAEKNSSPPKIIDFEIKDSHVQLLTSLDGPMHGDIQNYLVHHISQAKNSIYIQQPSWFTPSLVEALIRKKIQNPNVEIKLLLSPNEGPRLPMSLQIFAEKMLHYGIEYRYFKFPKSSAPAQYVVFDKKHVVQGTFAPTLYSLELPIHLGFGISHTAFAKKQNHYFLKNWSDLKNSFIIEPQKLNFIWGEKSYHSSDARVLNHLAMGILQSFDQINKPEIKFATLPIMGEASNKSAQEE